MCNECSEDIFHELSSLMMFEAIERHLQQKVNEGKLKVKEDFDYSKIPDSTAIYQCAACNENWMLSMPELYRRGYYLPQELAIKHLNDINKSDNKKKYGCLLILLLIVVSITYFIFV